MMVSLDLQALSSTRWHQYAVRFVLGGAITVATGLIARKFGPEIGGLFLAFPAIFPATATLISQRERDKKACYGFDGRKRGRQAASIDAAGAVLGAIGLCCFARGMAGPATLTAGRGSVSAALVWLGSSMALWWVRKHGPLSSRRHSDPRRRSGQPRK